MASRIEPVAKRTGPDSFRIERLLDAPVERVWEYLTDPELRARWFMGGPIDLRVGGKIGMRMDHESISPEPGETPERYRPYMGKTFEEEILAVDPPRLLSFTWDEGSRVTWTLEPVGERTRFTILHERVANAAGMANFASGWHTHSAVLAEVVAGRTPCNFWKLHEGVEDLYRREMGA